MEHVVVVTRERFAQGMTTRQYIEQMSMNKERFLAELASITIGPEDVQILERFAAPRSRRCRSSSKLAETTPRVEMRIFLRDENPDLMDQFLKNGLYRSIPVFAFFDEHMNELARFIERRPS